VTASDTKHYPQAKSDRDNLNIISGCTSWCLHKQNTSNLNSLSEKTSSIVRYAEKHRNTVPPGTSTV